MGGSLKLAMMNYAQGLERADTDIIYELASRGAGNDMRLVNSATRYWAACIAVFELNHSLNSARRRLDLDPMTASLKLKRREHFMRYTPLDWELIQRRYMAATTEPWRTNWPNKMYEDED